MHHLAEFYMIEAELAFTENLESILQVFCKVCLFIYQTLCKKPEEEHFRLINCIVCNLRPNKKLLALSKLKALAHDRLNVTQNIKFVFHRIENIEGIGENAGTQHFLFSFNVF